MKKNGVLIRKKFWGPHVVLDFEGGARVWVGRTEGGAETGRRVEVGIKNF